jgi:hypothetical protein
MENVKKDTSDLYPGFWNEFENNKYNREIRNNLVMQLLMKTQIDTSKFNTKLTLANFCDVLIFLLRKVENIFKNGLDNYLDILSVMCIYSSLIRELNIFEKSNTLNLVDDFIDIFNNFDNLIYKLDEKNEDISISNDVILSINKTRDLYLRVSQCI